MTFNCKRCGSCCKLIGCKHLIVLPDGSTACIIYEVRPAICRFGFSYTASGLTEAEYLERSYAACDRLREIVNEDMAITN